MLSELLPFFNKICNLARRCNCIDPNKGPPNDEAKRDRTEIRKNSTTVGDFDTLLSITNKQIQKQNQKDFIY